MFNGKIIFFQWPFSIAMLVITRGYFGRFPWKEHEKNVDNLHGKWWEYGRCWCNDRYMDGKKRDSDNSDSNWYGGWMWMDLFRMDVENLWIVIFEKNDHQILEEWIWKTDIVDGPAKSCTNFGWLRPETPWMWIRPPFSTGDSDFAAPSTVVLDISEYHGRKNGSYGLHWTLSLIPVSHSTD